MPPSIPTGPPPAPANNSLAFSVSTLLTEPLGAPRSYDLLEAHFRFGEVTAPVTGSVRLTHTDGSVMVSAMLALTIEEACSRCLEPFALPLRLEFQEEFWPAVDPLTREPLEIPEGRDGFPVVQGLLDLREAVRQSVEMSRPMQPHCQVECGGPAGGENALGRRNGAPADERWAALRDWGSELR